MPALFSTTVIPIVWILQRRPKVKTLQEMQIFSFMFYNIEFTISLGILEAPLHEVVSALHYRVPRRTFLPATTNDQTEKVKWCFQDWQPKGDEFNKLCKSQTNRKGCWPRAFNVHVVKWHHHQQSLLLWSLGCHITEGPCFFHLCSTQLNNKFGACSKTLLCCLFISTNTTTVTLENDLATIYYINLMTNIRSKIWPHWHQYEFSSASISTQVSTDYQAQHDPIFFWSIQRSLRILTTLPVTAATGGCSFSSLACPKNYCCTTVSKVWLTMSDLGKKVCFNMC